ESYHIQSGVAIPALVLGSFLLCLFTSGKLLKFRFNLMQASRHLLQRYFLLWYGIAYIVHKAPDLKHIADMYLIGGIGAVKRLQNKCLTLFYLAGNQFKNNTFLSGYYYTGSLIFDTAPIFYVVTYHQAILRYGIHGISRGGEHPELLVLRQMR